MVLAAVGTIGGAEGPGLRLERAPPGPGRLPIAGTTPVRASVRTRAPFGGRRPRGRAGCGEPRRDPAREPRGRHLRRIAGVPRAGRHRRPPLRGLGGARNGGRVVPRCTTSSSPVPRFTLAVADPREWLDLLLFLFVAIVVGRLAALGAERTEEAARRAAESTSLFAISRLLATAPDLETAGAGIVERLVRDVGLDRAWIVADRSNGQVVVADSRPGEALPTSPFSTSLARTPGDQPAKWVKAHEGSGGGRVAGPAPTTQLLKVRMQADDQAFGWLRAQRPLDAGLPSREETRLLALAADQLALALRREDLRRAATADRDRPPERRAEIGPARRGVARPPDAAREHPGRRRHARRPGAAADGGGRAGGRHGHRARGDAPRPARPGRARPQPDRGRRASTGSRGARPARCRRAHRRAAPAGPRRARGPGDAARRPAADRRRRRPPRRRHLEPGRERRPPRALAGGRRDQRPSQRRDGRAERSTTAGRASRTTTSSGCSTSSSASSGRARARDGGWASASPSSAA